MTTGDFIKEAERLRPLLIAQAVRYLDADDAEDTVQDALLRLWELRAELSMPVEPLAKVVTKNLCLDRLRRRQTALRIEDPQLKEPPDEDTDQWQRIERMMTLIEALPTLQQTILRLRHVEGMEYSEIARLTGSNEAAVRKALSRARLAIRDQYQKGDVS